MVVKSNINSFFLSIYHKEITKVLLFSLFIPLIYLEKQGKGGLHCWSASRNILERQRNEKKFEGRNGVDCCRVEFSARKPNAERDGNGEQES